MRVQFCKSIDVESDVLISTEDITTTLCEELADLKQCEHNRKILTFISDVYACLKAVDDSMIGLLTPKQRETIGRALAEQTKRYEVRS